ncbi:MAG TPA: NAD(P)/FAD-dependent oxidoreductase [Candidatus Bathyarchaeia archaeon]|nr:NAD(P)/FAD-dependent oxidoreductase [Candidatus Bathyarchaeia archaeon]
MADPFDLLVVGGGVIGCAIARELSRFRVSLCVVEMGGDVASGVSKANSGVIHSGINSNPGSLKAKTCIEGNGILPSMAKELNVPVSMSGKIVIAKNDDELGKLEEQESWGLTNGVPGMRRIDENKIHKMEPNITGKYGLWVPTAGIVSPYALTIALAESAVENGAKFLLDTKVMGITARRGTFDVETTRGRLNARSVVNSAGLHCDDIAKMVGLDTYVVYPSRGEYHILDKEYSRLISRPVYPVPPADSNVLGVHLTTTMEGNILVGPSAEFISDKDDTKTTREVMDQLIKEVRELLPSFPVKGVIKSYSGVRCKLRDRNGKAMTDFVMEEGPAGFINLMGIESPGLTGSPAIARRVREMIGRRINLVAKERFNATGYRYIRLGNVSREKRAEIVKKNPAYGEVVCRCEDVTRGEIEEGLANPLGAKTMVSVKYRCRAMMGRCQAGFCGPQIAQIIEKSSGMDIADVVLKGKDSPLFLKKVKG